MYIDDSKGTNVGVTLAFNTIGLEAQNFIINIGDTFTTGPTEAAYVVNELVQPASVIVSDAGPDVRVLASPGGRGRDDRV